MGMLILHMTLQLFCFADGDTGVFGRAPGKGEKDQLYVLIKSSVKVQLQNHCRWRQSTKQRARVCRTGWFTASSADVSNRFVCALVHWDPPSWRAVLQPQLAAEWRSWSSHYRAALAKNTSCVEALLEISFPKLILAFSINSRGILWSCLHLGCGRCLQHDLML